MSLIRVVIAEEHPLVGDALEQVLTADPEIEVVGRASSAGELLDVARQVSPRVVVLDLPSLESWTTVLTLARDLPGVCAVVVTAEDAPWPGPGWGSLGQSSVARLPLAAQLHEAADAVKAAAGSVAGIARTTAAATPPSASTSLLTDG